MVLKALQFPLLRRTVSSNEKVIENEEFNATVNRKKRGIHSINTQLGFKQSPLLSLHPAAPVIK